MENSKMIPTLEKRGRKGLRDGPFLIATQLT